MVIVMGMVLEMTMGVIDVDVDKVVEIVIFIKIV